MSKVQGYHKALSKKNAQREFNNTNTDIIPQAIGSILGGIIGSAGGTSGIIEGAKSGRATSQNIATRLGWYDFNTPMYVPLTESQTSLKDKKYVMHH